LQGLDEVSELQASATDNTSRTHHPSHLPRNHIVSLTHTHAHRSQQPPAALQNLVEKILRTKIWQSMYWKEHCFGLTAESLVDKAVALSHVGGTYGGQRKPTNFMCLLLKLLQLQPEKEIIIEFIKNEDYKYVRLLGAFSVPPPPPPVPLQRPETLLRRQLCPPNGGYLRLLSPTHPFLASTGWAGAINLSRWCNAAAIMEILNYAILIPTQTARMKSSCWCPPPPLHHHQTNLP